MPDHATADEQFHARVLLVGIDGELGQEIRTMLAVHLVHELPAGHKLLDAMPVDLAFVNMRNADIARSQIIADLISRQPGLILVAVSESGDIEAVEQAYREGAYDCIQLPGQAHILPKVVDRALECCRLAARLTAHSQTLEKQNRALVEAHQRLVTLEHDSLVVRTVQDLIGEIDAPLNAIQLNLNILMHNLAENEQASRRLGYLRDATEAILETVRLIRSMQLREEALQSVETTELLGETMGLLRQAGYLEKCAIQMDLPPNLPAVVCRPHQLRQSLLIIMLALIDIEGERCNLAIKVAVHSGSVEIVLFRERIPAQAAVHGIDFALTSARAVFEANGGVVAMHESGGDANRDAIRIAVVVPTETA